MPASRRDMPGDWRTAILLRYGEDEPVSKLAESIGKTEEEVRRMIEYSRQYLEQRLIEAGCIVKPGRKAA